jgi:transcriptional regulator with XRE-family HTH domain
MGRKASPAIPDWQRENTYPAQRIDARMKLKGISSAAMAEHLGCSPQAVNQYRRGIAFPTCQNLMKIAQKLGVTTDYLLGSAECTTPDAEEIRKVLGLSGATIEALREINPAGNWVARAYGEPIGRAIDMLLVTMHGKKALRAIDGYLRANFDKPFVITDERRPEFDEGPDREYLNEILAQSDRGGQVVSIPFEALGESMLSVISTFLRKAKEEAQYVNQEDSK